MQKIPQIKALTVAQAVKLGFTVYRWGCSGSYLPVKLPTEIAHHDAIYNSLLSQFSPHFDSVDAVHNDREEGCFHQMIECSEMRGAAGNKHNRFIVFGYYSHNGGIETWEAFGAVEVKEQA